MPDVELPGYGDLIDPKVDNVGVIIDKNLCFVRRGHLEVVMVALVVPLGLAHELQRRDLVKMDDVVGLVGELVGSLVGDQNAIDWVQVQEPHVLGQLGHMHLV